MNEFKPNSSVVNMAGCNELLSENSYNDEYHKRRYLENISAKLSTTFESPNESLVDKIVRQVEYLFSDANILNDKFLLKHIHRNKEGFISLKLIASLRKVKALSKDWRVVAYSLLKSTKLQMNDEKTKIRRICPLPLPEELDASRTVLVFNYLPACVTFEDIRKHLKRIGTVVSMVIVPSNADSVRANVKKTLASYEGIATFPFTVVKFEKSGKSMRAVIHTSHPTSILKVVRLVGDEKETSTHASPSPKSWYIEESSDYADNTKNIKSSGEGDGPTKNCKWIQMINKKNILDTKEPYMVILRQPRGPDSTNGFLVRNGFLGTLNHSRKCITKTFPKIIWMFKDEI